MLSAQALYLILALHSMSAAATQVLDVAQPKRQVRQVPAPAASRLASLVRASVVDELPAGWRLRRLQLADGGHSQAGLPGGELQVTTQLPDNLVAGYNLVDVNVVVGGTRLTHLQAHVELAPSVVSKQLPVVARGQEVMVVVRHGNVTVQVKGTAQQAAGIGERIFVLPNSGTHTLQAVVQDAATVEVPL